MESSFYEQTAQAEDRHWWFASRRKLVANYLDRLGVRPGSRILDIGCGTGGTTHLLERFGHVTGIDRSEEALRYARKKAAKSALLQADVNDLDDLFKPASFDLVTLFCVLYHQWIRDDVDALRRIARILKPGGLVLLTEPAFKVLTRGHDVADHGRTRYRLGDFRSFFSRVELNYVTGRYFNVASFPICLASALSHRLRGGAETKAQRSAELAIPPRPINAMLRWMLDAENRLGTWFPSPVGVTLLVVGRKPMYSAMADATPAMRVNGAHVSPQHKQPCELVG